jgi:1-deoxy-D-xylulose-5-phosphate synthase
MFTAQLPREGGAFTIRYPRGQGVMSDWRKPMQAIEIGTGRTVREGSEVALLTIGHIGNYVVEACEYLQEDGLDPAHYDMRFVKPLDEALLHKVFKKFRKIVTVEDGCIMGGFGSAVAEFMVDHGYQARIERLGIPDRIVEHGEQRELHAECNFDPEGIANAVRKLAESNVRV